MGYIANVNFVKYAQKDNWENGCEFDTWVVCDDSFNRSFENKEDLLDKLGDWISNNFDVKKEEFLKYVENEIENNRFDYNQNEDADGNRMNITEDNPNGYLADYIFSVDVMKEVNYNFQ